MEPLIFIKCITNFKAVVKRNLGTYQTFPCSYQLNLIFC